MVCPNCGAALEVLNDSIAKCVGCGWIVEPRAWGIRMPLDYVQLLPGIPEKDKPSYQRIIDQIKDWVHSGRFAIPQIPNFSNLEETYMPKEPLYCLKYTDNFTKKVWFGVRDYTQFNGELVAKYERIDYPTVTIDVVPVSEREEANK